MNEALIILAIVLPIISSVITYRIMKSKARPDIDYRVQHEKFSGGHSSTLNDYIDGEARVTEEPINGNHYFRDMLCNIGTWGTLFLGNTSVGLSLGREFVSRMNWVVKILRGRIQELEKTLRDNNIQVPKEDLEKFAVM